jgi:hypothetical protein
MTHDALSDDEFLDALEQTTLPPEAFSHAAHVRAAYLYVRRGGFADGLVRMRQALLAYTAALGKTDRYHETITVAFMALVSRHLHDRGDGGGWLGFARGNPDLFAPDLLLRYYPRDLLASDVARRVFVLPPGGGPT